MTGKFFNNERKKRSENNEKFEFKKFAMYFLDVFSFIHKSCEEDKNEKERKKERKKKKKQMTVKFVVKNYDLLS